MRRIHLGALLAALLATSAVYAAGKNVVDKETVEQNIATLHSQVVFHRSLDEAKAEAKAKGKLVFWMQLLGDMDGGT